MSIPFDFIAIWDGVQSGENRMRTGGHAPYAEGAFRSGSAPFLAGQASVRGLGATLYAPPDGSLPQRPVGTSRKP